MKFLKDQPISVPENPFWKVFKTFGRDELNALLLSLLATLGVTGLLKVFPLPVFWSATLLALSGPVFEKLGFFVWHIKDAIEVYASSPLDSRKRFRYYAKRAFRGGMKSLIWDILVHDPIYIALMFGGMYFNPSTSAWLLVPVAFGIAVMLVALLDVGLGEFRYKLLYLKLRGLGFKRVSYLESRFIMNKDTESPDLTALFEKSLGNSVTVVSPKVKIITYVDKYYETDLPEYNGRSPLLRIRRKVKDSIQQNRLQVVFTRAEEQTNKTLSQYRFFPQKKDKYSCSVVEESLGALSNEKLRMFARKITKESEPIRTVSFSRHVISDKCLYMAVDEIGGVAPCKVIELKVFSDGIQTLRKAMRCVMNDYSVTQTTYNKIMLQMSEKS